MNFRNKSDKSIVYTLQVNSAKPKLMTGAIEVILIIGQHVFMKSPLKPSGPGALSVGRSCTASSISSFEKGVDRCLCETMWACGYGF